MRRHFVPLGMPHCTADRTEQYAVTCQTAVHGFFWKRNTGCINGTTTNEIRGAGKGMTILLSDFLQNSHCTVYDFRADTVAADDGYCFVHCRFSFMDRYSFRMSSKQV